MTAAEARALCKLNGWWPFVKTCPSCRRPHVELWRKKPDPNRLGLNGIVCPKCYTKGSDMSIAVMLRVNGIAGWNYLKEDAT